MHLDLTKFGFSGREIVFLLGAGASVDADVKSLAQIMSEIEKDFANNNIEGTPDSALKSIEEIYFYFKKNSIKPGHLREGSIEFGAYNIEDILSNIRNVLDDKDNPNKSTYTSVDRTLLQIIHNDYEILQKAYTYLSRKIINRIAEQTRKCDSKANYLFYLFFLLQELQESINVFTLNFDLVVEHAHNNYLGLTKTSQKLLETGVGEDKVFHPERLDYDPEKKLVYYHKLHGSLNWKKLKTGMQNEGRIIEIKEDEIERILDDKDDNTILDHIIFGTSQKYRSEAPYTFLYGNFIRALKNAKMLVVIGYSFTDTHINNAIRDAISYNESLFILIVAPNLKDTTRYWLDEDSPKSVRISPKTELQSPGQYAAYLKQILERKEYHDTLYSLKMYSYSRNFDEDALYLCKLYQYYLFKPEYQDLLDDLGWFHLSDPKRTVLLKYVNEVGRSLDKIFVSQMQERESEPYDNWLRADTVDYRALIDKLKETSVQAYNAALHAESGEKREVLNEFENKIEILLFFFEDFLHEYFKRKQKNLRLYDDKKSQDLNSDTHYLFLFRLRIIEQLILAYYLTEYLKLSSLKDKRGGDYDWFNESIKNINSLIQGSHFYLAAQKMVRLLKLEDELKINKEQLPTTKKLSKFNRQVIRIVGSDEREVQEALSQKTKLALSAFIEKNKFLKSLISLAEKEMEVTYTNNTDDYSEILNEAKRVFNNQQNNFSDDELIELLLKANSNLLVFAKIFNDINKKTIDLFLNSNYEQKRIGKGFFKEKLGFKNNEGVQLRRSTAENFFTNELRLRNLFKYYHNYYRIFEF